MDGFLDRAGQTLLLTLAPGRPFVGAMAGLVVAAALLRLRLGDGRFAGRWLAGWRAVEHIVITGLLVGMIFLSLAQIVLRNLFETGFVWLDPLLRHGVLWIGFLGAMLATADDRHVAIDALSRLLHGTAARAMHALLRLVAAAVALLLANAAYVFARDELTFGSTSFLGVPTWVLVVIMPWGLVVMSYRFVRSAISGKRSDPVPQTAENEAQP